MTEGPERDAAFHKWMEANYFEHPGRMRQRLSIEIRDCLLDFVKDPPRLSIRFYERVMCNHRVPQSFVPLEFK